MRKVLFVLAILSLAFSVAGAKDFQKYSCSDLITFDSGSRQGGDTMETATVIDGFPFSSTGSTVGLANDYDVVCPYGGSTAPDAVYTFTVDGPWTLDLTLCAGSDYDTKLYVADGEGNVVGCNDDSCPGYVSEIIGLEVVAGTYFVFVDGYSTDSGNYTLDITGEAGTVPPEPGETCDTALVAVEGWNTAPFAVSYFTYTTSEEPGDLLISSCTDFQTVDTQLYVYDACDGNLVASNDDDDLGCGEAGTFNYASTASFPATALTTYFIMWGDYWSSDGFEFFIGEVVNGVSNDDTSFGAVKAMFR